MAPNSAPKTDVRAQPSNRATTTPATTSSPDIAMARPLSLAADRSERSDVAPSPERMMSPPTATGEVDTPRDSRAGGRGRGAA